MTRILFLLSGVFFGALLYKGEVISWFRIQEMFRFQSFHMYGVLFSAVGVGVVSLQVLKWRQARSWSGEDVTLSSKTYHHGTWIGGFLFGMGWALTGACPGPLFAQVGAGNGIMAVALLSAIVGTWCYAALRPRLPH